MNHPSEISSRRHKKPQSTVMSLALFAIGLFGIFTLYFMVMHHHVGANIKSQVPTSDHMILNVDNPVPQPIEHVTNIPTSRVDDVANQYIQNGESNLNINANKPSQSIPDKTSDKLLQSSLSSVHAVTYASHGGSDDRFCRAVESAVRHDVKLIILGWGVKWIGLSQKLEAAHGFAASIPPNDIILFTDAFDVMFTNTPDHILAEFTKENSDIIFAGEIYILDMP